MVGTVGIKDPVDLSDLPPGSEHRGWAPDVDVFLRASDIFVLPSHAEGMSNALLEAMASGLPCVASRVGAAHEMIVDDQTGLLVNSGDIVALADAIRRLASDGELRARLGHAARQSVSQRYGIESVVQRILDGYESILSPR